MRRVAVVLAVVSFGAVVAPAMAQGGFADYRQAAADQYASSSGNAPPAPTAVTAPSTTAPTGVAPTGTAKKKTTKKKSTKKNGSTNKPTGSTLGTGFSSPVTVGPDSNAPPTVNGQLPYTGGPLGVIVLIALGFLAAGFLLAAALRLRRPRSEASA